jgi:arginine decarboxylase
MTQLSPVLLVSPAGGAHAPSDAALLRVGEALAALGYRIVRASSTEEGLALVKSQPVFAAVVLDWDLGDGRRCPRDAALAIIRGVRARSRLLPVFLAVATTSPATLPFLVARDVHGYLHPLAEAAETTAHRLDFAIRQYYAGLLPPYLRALKQQVDDGPYVWGGAGHQGGEVYRRHPVGAEFQRLLGDGLARSDIGVRTPASGDGLAPTATPAESERRAARVFGADWSSYVLGGSSAANRIVVNSVVARDDIVLADRASHRSVVHAWMLAGARPVYLKPAVNAFGMIGPVPPWSLAPGHLDELIAHSAVARGAASPDPVLASFANSTGDGLCCDVDRVVRTMGSRVPRLHFDEAAFGYAHFHPMYDRRHAMGAAAEASDRPTLIAVHSAHEALPAFSMASMVHVRSGPRELLDAPVFQQSCLMHGTTSPFHPILASADVATAMMELPAGRTLLDEAIRDAIGFRQAMAATRARFLESEGPDAWFFDVFQPPRVVHPVSGASLAFADAAPDTLASHPACWTLKPGEGWHGFADVDVEGNYVLVDPLQVTILCPGVDVAGPVVGQGVPACVLTQFLAERRIHVARSGLYTVLVRFAVGAEPGRWGTVIEALHEFKRFYDTGVTAGEALPRLVAAHPQYGDLTLRRLCDNVHAALTALGVLRLVGEVAAAYPEPAMTPAAAYQELLRGRTESVPLCDAAGRVAAAVVVPHHAGMPSILPGERLGLDGCVALQHLQALEAMGRTFPGFGLDVHGVERDLDGSFLLRVVIDDRRRHTAPPPRAVVHESRRAAGTADADPGST